MKKSILWLFSLCLLACGFLTSCEKQNATNEELIIGTWKIHSISSYIADELKDKFYPEYYEGESFSWTFKQNGVWIEEVDGDAYTHRYDIEEDNLFLISNGGGYTLFKIVSIDSQKMKVRNFPEDEDNNWSVYEFKKQ